MPKLAFVVGHSTGVTNQFSDVEIAANKHYIAQCAVINGTNDVFHGPDLWRDYWNPTYRNPDGDIHYSTIGQEHFGQMWAASLTPSFFSNSTPYPAAAQ